MSHFLTVASEMKSEASLIDALVACGFTREQIEVCGAPQHLYGYKGDKRQQVADIIIRRKYIGSASNDIGFKKQEDGTYQAIISEYDSYRFGEKWLAKLKQEYSLSQTLKVLAARKMRAKVERKADGTVRVVAARAG